MTTCVKLLPPMCLFMRSPYHHMERWMLKPLRIWPLKLWLSQMLTGSHTQLQWIDICWRWRCTLSARTSPGKLIAKIVRRHFPQCEACPAGYMAQNPIPQEASGESIYQERSQKSTSRSESTTPRRSNIGERLSDVRVRWQRSSWPNIFKIGNLLTSHKSLEVALEELRVELHGTGHTLKVIRMDNEFWMAPVWTWAASCEPCIPHEHHSIGTSRRCCLQKASRQEALVSAVLGIGL